MIQQLSDAGLPPEGPDLPGFVLRRLGSVDADPYRRLRIEALRTCPELFGASWEVEASQRLEWFAERLQSNFVVGGWREASEALVGIAGLHVPEALKSRHKGQLWGMFVSPEARGRGLGSALLSRVIGRAASEVEAITASVVAGNAAAISLYLKAGFVEFGLEQRALKIESRYYDEHLMTLSLRRLKD